MSVMFAIPQRAERSSDDRLLPVHGSVRWAKRTRLPQAAPSPAKFILAHAAVEE
jgi:hypothetical protein